MAINRTKQAKQMLQNGGMLVSSSKNGRRPGYRSARAQEVQGRTSSSNSSKNSSGGGGNTNRERGIMSRGLGPKGTTKSIRDFRDTGPDRSKVSQFSQYGKNVFARNLDPTLKFNPRTGGMKKSFTGGLGSFLGTLLGFLTGNPFVSLAMGGFDRLKNVNQRLQNSDFGKSKSLMDFLDMRKYGGYDEREEARRLNMEDAKRIQRLIDSGEFGSPNNNRERAILGLPTIGRVDLNDLEGLSKLDFLGRTNLNDLEGLSGLDFLGRENLNDYEGILEDKGLTVSPGSIIDQGLTVSPGSIIDQGLTVSPGSIIDQGEIIALANGGRTNPMDKEILTLNDAKKMAPPGESLAYINKDEAALLKSLGGAGEDINGTGIKSYFIKKLARKAKKVAKKVFKSPLGKVALGLAAFKFAPAFLSGKGFGLGKAKTFSDLAFFGKDANVNVARLIGVPSLLAGLTTPKQEDEEIDIAELYGSGVIDPNAQLNKRILGTQFSANGGRIGYSDGSDDKKNKPKKLPIEIPLSPLDERINELYKRLNLEEGLKNLGKDKRKLNAEGGFQKEPVAKKVMPLLDMGGMEKDYRADGGFVPIGRMEKADDVPARLSKNEFVFTADAVRNAGGGDVDKGSEVMYNMMKNLEAGGEISEESQGLEGAREMFQTSQRLGEVI